MREKLRSRKEIIAKADEYLNKYGHSNPFSTTLLWVLKLKQNEDNWIRLQEDFHKHHQGHIWRIGEDKRIPTYLEWIGKGKKVLDCGTHTGYMGSKVMEYGNEVIGVDLPKVVEAHKGKYKFPVHVGNVYDMKSLFEDESFDIVIAGEIVEHLTNPRLFLKEAYRVLKKGGLLIITCPYNQDVVTIYTHCNSVNEEFLEKHFKGLFKVKEKKILVQEILSVSNNHNSVAEEFLRKYINNFFATKETLMVLAEVVK